MFTNAEAVELRDNEKSYFDSYFDCSNDRGTFLDDVIYGGCGASDWEIAVEPGRPEDERLLTCRHCRRGKLRVRVSGWTNEPYSPTLEDLVDQQRRMAELEALQGWATIPATTHVGAYRIEPPARGGTIERWTVFDAHTGRSAAAFQAETDAHRWALDQLYIRGL